MNWWVFLLAAFVVFTLTGGAAALGELVAELLDARRRR